MHLDYLKQT